MAEEEKGLDSARFRAVLTPLEGVSDPVQQAAALKGLRLIHAGHFGPREDERTGEWSRPIAY